MLISVIIPTYKPQEYIRDCLASLARQTLSISDFEILIILNGCGKEYLKYVNDVVADLNIMNAKVFFIEEGGVSNARNFGLEHSSGDYIAFVDDDDYVSSSYLKELLDKSDKDTVAISNTLAFTDKLYEFNADYSLHKVYESLRSNARKRISLASSRSMFNGPCMKLISKEIISSSRFDRSFKNGEDGLFMYEISKNISNVRLADERAIYYRRFREGSAVTVRKKKSYIIGNCMRLMYAVAKRYFQHPFSYNLPFTLSRIMGPVKGAIYEFLSLNDK